MINYMTLTVKTNLVLRVAALTINDTIKQIIHFFIF